MSATADREQARYDARKLIDELDSRDHRWTNVRTLRHFALLVLDLDDEIGAAEAALQRERQRTERLEAVMRENVGDAYNLLTQGESPTQRRQPSAQRIYDRSKAALSSEPEPRTAREGTDE